MNLTSNLSCITIESQIGESFIWWSCSWYKRINWDTKWYTIILDNQVEKLSINSIEDLAKVIDSYEREFNSLTLTNNE
jgi:glycine betaine/choline ABC-type transport system substrate-binding protein